MKAKIRDNGRVRLTCMIDLELMRRLHAAFEASSHKSRTSLVVEILDNYLSEQS